MVMLIFEKIFRHNIHVCVIELNEIADMCDWTIQNCWYSTALELIKWQSPKFQPNIHLLHICEHEKNVEWYI